MTGCAPGRRWREPVGCHKGGEGRPRVPSKAQQSKRLRAAGAPESEIGNLFELVRANRQ